MRTSLQDFEVLMRRAGLDLTPAEIASVHTGWGYVEPMLERLRTPTMPREAEPVATFRPDGHGVVEGLGKGASA